MRDLKDINNAFIHHPPTGDQAPRYSLIREAGREMATTIFHTCPPSAERTLALRDIQRAVMMANASIALNPPKDETLSEAPAG